MIITLVIFVFLLYLLFRFSTRNHNYWLSKGIDGPKPHPLFGNIFEIIRKPQLEDERFRKYGRIYGHYIFNEPVITIGEPELIKKILVNDSHIFPNRSAEKERKIFGHNGIVKMSDEEWLRSRCLFTSAFSSYKISKLFKQIENSVTCFLKTLDDHIGSNALEFDIKRLFDSYTIDVMTKCTHSESISSLSDNNNIFIKTLRRHIDTPMWTDLINIWIPEFILSRIFSNSYKLSEDYEYFNNYFLKIINNRKDRLKQDMTQYNDIIELFLNEKPYKEATSKTTIANKKQYDLNSNESKAYTNEEIVKNILVLFVEGFELIRSLLTFCAYDLAMNPNSQHKLYEEIRNCQQIDNYDIVIKLRFLDAVICETLRLHSPITRTDRIAVSDYKLGDTAIIISAGTRVIIPIQAVHNDSKHFPNPNKYLPQRFYGENKNYTDKSYFLPFGSGPRTCVGLQFTLLLTKIMLANILIKYKFVKSDKTVTNLTRVYSITGVLQTPEIVMSVVKRV